MWKMTRLLGKVSDNKSAVQRRSGRVRRKSAQVKGERTACGTVKEFWSLLRHFDIKALMLTPSDNIVIQMFRYLFVGGIAFLADNGSYALLLRLVGAQQYILLTAVSFVLGLIVNFVLSKWLVFSKERARVRPVPEFLAYALIGVIGLGITAVLVWLNTWLLAFWGGSTALPLTAWPWNGNETVLGWQAFAAKLVAAAVVLVWNFTARKLLIYTKR